MNSWSNEDLARLLRPQLNAAPPEQVPAPRPATRPEQPTVEAARANLMAANAARASLREIAQEARPLDEEEIRTLFFALRRGTDARLGRKPTAAELQQLVDAVNRARQLSALAGAALQGSFDVYWDGSDWAFESRTAEGPVELAA